MTQKTRWESVWMERQRKIHFLSSEEDSNRGPVQMELDDSLHFYLDSAAD